MKKSRDGLSAVRQAREQISREHGNDPQTLVAYYMDLQDKHRSRLIGLDQPASAEDAKRSAPRRPEAR